ncbi:hypothetical protein [Streptomyces gilvosporeus]|uniref:hypothetical protein n=1 Tax=Streptomyces gilvosporeus TaxID=553510 RepID=UPI0033F3E2DD
MSRGTHARPRITVDGALCTVWAVGSAATLGLLGALWSADSAPLPSRPSASAPDSASEALSAVHTASAHTCRCGPRSSL